MFEIDKEEAINICRNLCYEFGRSNPDVVEIIYSSKELMLLSDLPKKSSFTRGEKQLLRTIGMMLQADYSMTDLKHQDVDYGAMRVHVELLERALIDGLEDRNISIIEIDVLFNDVLKEYRVEYDNSDSGDQLAGVYIHWNAMSELYNSYSSYKVSYKSFDEHSISILASATERYKDYQNKTEEEKQILSVNGVAADFAAAVEHEFKKIISLIYGESKRTFFDSIGLLEKMKTYKVPMLEELAKKEYIEKLHFIRMVHNDIDHGNRLITEEELDELYHITVFGNLCQLLSDTYYDLKHD